MKKGLLLIVLLMPAWMLAQEITYQDDKQDIPKAGIMLGKFIFAPSIEVLYEYKDNLYLTETNEISDELLTVRPKLLFELPKEESYLKFSWVPQYREFKKYDLKQKWTNFFDLSGKFKTSGGLELDFTDTYTYKGALEVSQVDLGHELMFSSAPFNRNYFNMSMSYYVNETDGFGINAAQMDVIYEHPKDQPPPLWYDYTNMTYGASYQRYLSELLRMALGINFLDFNPENTLGARAYDGQDYYVRFYGDMSPTVNASIKLGYEDLAYKKYGYHYKSWDAETDLIWNFSNDSNITAAIVRMAYPSNYADAVSYTGNGIRLTYNFKPGERLFGGVSAMVARNSYNEFNRTDDLWSANANIAYHFSQLTSVRVNFVHEDRKSTADKALCWQGCNYTSDTIMLNFVLGY